MQWYLCNVYTNSIMQCIMLFKKKFFPAKFLMHSFWLLWLCQVVWQTFFFNCTKELHNLDPQFQWCMHINARDIVTLIIKQSTNFPKSLKLKIWYTIQHKKFSYLATDMVKLIYRKQFWVNFGDRSGVSS